MEAIIVKNVVITVKRFIAAEIAFGSSVRIYLEGMPEDEPYISIYVGKKEDPQKILEEILEKINKTIDNRPGM